MNCCINVSAMFLLEQITLQCDLHTCKRTLLQHLMPFFTEIHETVGISTSFEAKLRYFTAMQIHCV